VRTKTATNQTLFVGIDNGVSGSISVLYPNGTSAFFKTPTFSEQSYTKAKQNITRIDVEDLEDFFIKIDYRVSTSRNEIHRVQVALERPMVNPQRFKASASALRALEATLCLIERFEWPLVYVDSKQWQKMLLPKGTKGTPELKKASLDIGCRMFPVHKELIHKHGDADGLLIAEWLRRREFR